MPSLQFYIRPQTPRAELKTIYLSGRLGGVAKAKRLILKKPLMKGAYHRTVFTKFGAFGLKIV